MSLQQIQILKPFNVAKQFHNAVSHLFLFIVYKRKYGQIFFLIFIVAFAAHTPSFSVPL